MNERENNDEVKGEKAKAAAVWGSYELLRTRVDGVATYAPIHPQL